VAASDKVAAKNLVDAGRLQSFRIELFDVRAEILELMKRFRANQA
jgi:hypothetical protein